MGTRQLNQMQLAMDTAKKNEDEAASRLYSIKQKLAEEEQRLKTLLHYQQEYQKKATEKSLETMHGALYHNQQIFIKNITEAVTKQYQQVEKFKVILDKQAQLWYSLKARTQALATLITEIQKKLAYEENKREQQLQDELVQNKRRASE